MTTAELAAWIDDLRARLERGERRHHPKIQAYAHDLVHLVVEARAANHQRVVLPSARWPARL